MLRSSLLGFHEYMCPGVTRLVFVLNPKKRAGEMRPEDFYEGGGLGMTQSSLGSQ